MWEEQRFWRDCLFRLNDPSLSQAQSPRLEAGLYVNGFPMFGLRQFSMFLNSFAFPARNVIMDQTSLKLIFKLHLVDYNRPILNDSFEIGSW